MLYVVCQKGGLGGNRILRNVVGDKEGGCCNERACVQMTVLIRAQEIPSMEESVVKAKARHELAFTRYCYYQYCMVYGMHMGGLRGGRILPNSRAIVLHKDRQCR